MCHKKGQQKTAKRSVLAVFRGRGSRNLPFAVPEKAWHIRRCATFSTAAPAFHDLHPPPAAVAQATHGRGFDKAPLKAKAPTICRCFRGRGSRNRTHDTRFWSGSKRQKTLKNLQILSLVWDLCASRFCILMLY